jgi:hypothetical protein
MSERDDAGRSDAESAFGGGLPDAGADAFGGSSSPPPKRSEPAPAPPPPPPSDAGYAPPQSPTPGGFTPPPSEAPAYGAPSSYDAQPGYGVQPGYGAEGTDTKTSGKAIASLVVSLVGALVCPVVLSIVAIVLGSQAKKEIDANPAIGGRGLAQAGFVIGIIGLAFYAVIIVVAIASDA